MVKYGIVEPKKLQFPVRMLLVVPHKGKRLIVSYPAFGTNTFEGNRSGMNKIYSHPQTLKQISFKTPTTSESISASAWNFENIAKQEIFNPKWLQAGYIVQTSEGVYVNPLRKGVPITDEKVLKSYLDKSKKVNGIYLYEGKDMRDFGFAPYDTFKQGLQDAIDFANGGLARVLEHTEETALNLENMAKSYPNRVMDKSLPSRVNVVEFDSVTVPVLRVVSLDSGRDFVNGKLSVGGYDLNCEGGFAFGILK
ncbi:MAG: hypothetical protein PHD81_04170 [Candidatus Nanoarchaeia archaeon]|nr:hypothetical protein [Candidatus Nanoarchaeia archaeon]MDD5588278.1 hypothetical protein [Candidatus Nanoarchaeia archaeon]